MKHFLALAFTLLSLPALAQTDFQWKKDLDLPYTDPEGNALTGTEVVHLVAHKGKLYAGNSYWNEDSDPRRGQVWVKESYNGNWKRDYQMPVKHSRVPSLYSFTFSSNYLGASIPPDTILFAAATYDKGSNVNGPAVVFMRNDASGTWVLHNLGYTDHPFDYTQVRSMGFHRDRVSGEDIVFAGANPAPTGVYAGRYNASAAGKIQWDSNPEFMPAGYQRIMGFAVCQDTLYMATQREIYKRIDGPSPAQRWVQVFDFANPVILATYGQDIDPYWLNDEDIRGFRTIQGPDGQEALIFGALNHIFRLEPHANYQLIAEQDIENVLEISTGHDFHYLQTQIIKDYTHPLTQETVQLIGFEAMYDTTYLRNNPQPNLGWFNQQGWYFERRQQGGSITYTHKEIADLSISPQPDSLARVRTFEVSPFPQDSGRVIYSGGFAPWFIGGVSKTAWIYRGSLAPLPVQGYTSYLGIPYASGSPQDELSLDVYVPNGGQAQKPVMVYVHGGSWRTGDKANTGYKDEFFTGQDYVFVSVNYRLSPDPINLSDPGRIQFPTHPQDLAKALRWVFEHIGDYGGDTAKVSLIGHSAGAHLVSLVASDEAYLGAEGLQLSRIRCVCSLDAGAYDINYYMQTYETPGSGQWNTYENAFGSDTAVWRQASPIEHLGAGKGIADFMLVHQGTAQRVDLAGRFAQALATHSIPFTLLNAYPLDHAGINTVLGSPQPQVQIYNDSIARFFTHCISNTVLAVEKPLELAQRILIYPNPANAALTVQLDGRAALDGMEIQLWQAQGKLLQIIHPQSYTQKIDLSAYPAGMYMVQVRQGGALLMKKVVKR